MTRTKLWPQVAATMVATLGTFGLGNVMSWTAPALPHMEVTWLDTAILGTARLAFWLYRPIRILETRF